MTKSHKEKLEIKIESLRRDVKNVEREIEKLRSEQWDTEHHHVKESIGYEIRNAQSRRMEAQKRLEKKEKEYKDCYQQAYQEY